MLEGISTTTDNLISAKYKKNMKYTENTTTTIRKTSRKKISMFIITLVRINFFNFFEEMPEKLGKFWNFQDKFWECKLISFLLVLD